MRFSLQPRYNDYDSKGHVNNAVYLTYFELGRVYAWEAAGGTTDDASSIAWLASLMYCTSLVATSRCNSGMNQR